MNIRVVFLLLLISACSREQTNVAVGALGKAYNSSYRDDVIKNWQAKVSSSPHCVPFKERFKVVGERYDSAANGAFVNDMMKIWEETKSSGCAGAI